MFLMLPLPGLPGLPLPGLPGLPVLPVLPVLLRLGSLAGPDLQPGPFPALRPPSCCA